MMINCMNDLVRERREVDRHSEPRGDANGSRHAADQDLTRGGMGEESNVFDDCSLLDVKCVLRERLIFHSRVYKREITIQSGGKTA